MSFREWTVLPHDNIEKMSPHLWTVSGTMPRGNQRRMTIVRLADGRLVVHNALALDDVEMNELDQWGEVAALVVPNAFHRQDLFIYKSRYKNAQVYCPAGAVKAVAKIVDVDGDYSQIPCDVTFSAEHLAGMKNAEGVLSVVEDSGTTLKDRKAFLAQMERLAKTDLKRIIVGHGQTVSTDVPARFEEAIDRLR